MLALDLTRLLDVVDAAGVPATDTLAAAAEAVQAHRGELSGIRP